MLTGEVAVRVRDLIRQIALEHELVVLSGKVARAKLVAFIGARVTIHFWARGYLAVSSGTLTDEMIQEYIEAQDGEPIRDDSQFPIDNS